jgi:hypothetical protein
VDPDGARSDSASEGKKAGAWIRANEFLTKGGLKKTPVTIHWFPGGAQFTINKNSKAFDFTGKALRLAGGFLPEAWQKHAESASNVVLSVKYLIEVPEVIADLDSKSEAWRLARVELKSAEKALLDVRNAFNNIRYADPWREEVALAAKRAVWPGVAAAASKARVAARKSYLDFARSRIGPAKTFFGGSTFVLNKIFKFQESDSDLALGVGLGAQLGSAIVEFADLKLRDAAGAVSGQAEISIAGGYLKGAAAGRLIRGASAWQAYDIGYLGGKAGLALAYYAVDPGAAREYLLEVAAFEKHGGYGAHVLGGIIDAASDKLTTSNGYGIGASSRYFGRKLGYSDLTDALREFGDWHPIDDFWNELTGVDMRAPISVLLNGLDAP